MKEKVLFVCTGNYYRSRFAEILFNHWAKQQDLAWEAFSRGFRPSSRNVGEMSVYTFEGLKERDIPIGEVRFPLKLEEKDLASAAQIIALKEAEHRQYLEKEFPHWIEQVTFWHVHDLDVASPEEALPQIEMQVERLIEQLTQKKDKELPRG